MTWASPWAWWGLAALAVPIAVHLLTRAQPTPLPFPTLRFLRQATSTAVRRRAIKDRALLAVRLGILAAVVAALAQPTTNRIGAGATAPVVRAVVLDTSEGAPVENDRIARLTPAAAESVTIATPRLAPGIVRAANWLAERGGRAELVVVSAFRRGDLEASDLAPADRAGIRLLKIDTPPVAGTTAPPQLAAGRLWTPFVTADAERTLVTWTSSAPGSAAVPFVRVLAATGAQDDASAAVKAASVVGVPAAGAHPIAIVLPEAPDRAAAMASANAIDEPWMFDVVNALRQDSALNGAVGRLATVTTPEAKPPVSTRLGTPVVRDATGSSLVDAASGPAASGRELRLFVGTRDPLVISALVAGAARAERDPTALRRLEPITLTADELRRWERPIPSAGAPATAPESGAWQGRWLWLAALVLLGIETWMRRPAPASASVEVTHARVA